MWVEGRLPAPQPRRTCKQGPGCEHEELWPSPAVGGCPSCRPWEWEVSH